MAVLCQSTDLQLQLWNQNLVLNSKSNNLWLEVLSLWPLLRPSIAAFDTAEADVSCLFVCFSCVLGSRRKLLKQSLGPGEDTDPLKALLSPRLSEPLGPLGWPTGLDPFPTLPFPFPRADLHSCALVRFEGGGGRPPLTCHSSTIQAWSPYVLVPLCFRLFLVLILWGFFVG